MGAKKPGLPLTQEGHLLDSCLRGDDTMAPAAGLLRRSASPTVGRGKWLPSAKMFLFFSYSAFFGSLGEGIGVSAC